jgi:predicted component of type VI protein secretion system
VEAKLVVVGGEMRIRQYVLRLPTVIGRSRSNDLMLGHPLVSRQHCEVFEANGMLMVRDLGSLNGTFVGELRIAEQPMPVKPGDLLTIGPVTFRAEYRTGGRRSKSTAWNADGPTVDAPLPGPVDDVKDTPARAKRKPGKNGDATPPPN